MRTIFFTTILALIPMFTWAASNLEKEELLLKNSLAVVTVADYETELARLPEDLRSGIELSAQRISQVLSNILVIKTLAAEAVQKKADEDPETKRLLKWANEKNLAMLRMEKIVADGQAAVNNKAAEARAREIYKTEQEKYKEPPMTRASHILVDFKTRTKEDALKRAQEVRRLALEGKPFSDLAKEYSDDSSVKQNQGDLGFFTATQMVKPFADAAFALDKPGAISEVVESSFGYHVIILHEKKPGGVQPFEKVKAGIINALKEKQGAEARAEYIKKISSDSKLVVNQEAIAKLKKAVPEVSHIHKP